MLRYYDLYKHLMGVPYDDGDKDCYGLARRFYADNYQIDLPNYARSSSFFADGIDLISPFLAEEDFQVVDVAPSRLQLGDGLLMSVYVDRKLRGQVNHIAVFVGNQTFIHHMFKKPSCEDAMTPNWSSRVMCVLRHPQVTARNIEMLSNSSVQLIEVLSENAKRKLGADAALLEQHDGEVRSNS